MDLKNIINTMDELYKTKNIFEEIYNHTADAINILDLNGNVKQVNPSFETLYGWKESELAGKPLPTIPPELKTEMADFIREIKGGKTIKGYESIRKKRNGTYIDIELSYSGISDLNGELVALAGIGRDITAKKKSENYLKYLAFHDPLTGLPNRRFFLDTLERKLKEEHHNQRKFAVLYMDVDDFKKVNDSFGHNVGDELLKQFSQRIKNNLEHTDLIGRIAGDEFTVLINHIKEEEHAAQIAKRLIDSLQIPWAINNYNFNTSSSIGITISRKNDDEKKILKRADIALYHAKENGKNNYHFL